MNIETKDYIFVPGKPRTRDRRKSRRRGSNYVRPEAFCDCGRSFGKSCAARGMLKMHLNANPGHREDVR